MLQSETALTRGHWRDLGDGFSRHALARPCSRSSSPGASPASASAPRTSPQVFLAKNTFHAGDFGYGLIYGAIGGGLVLGASLAAMLLERIGPARTYAAASC